ncbi:hypothetical protein HOLleu_04870 [Holothuria leucospilota]|uniref:Uncharacterized protein n=1 Tax=Holothuria leucospilota TaxID=206669 RepID=A0A9Q1CK62_HOLLE|nr:hypothetical protein HOLleu_04870 [Holothuria leucospilota]
MRIAVEGPGQSASGSHEGCVTNSCELVMKLKGDWSAPAPSHIRIICNSFTPCERSTHGRCTTINAFVGNYPYENFQDPPVRLKCLSRSSANYLILFLLFVCNIPVSLCSNFTEAILRHAPIGECCLVPNI